MLKELRGDSGNYARASPPCQRLLKQIPEVLIIIIIVSHKLLSRRPAVVLSSAINIKPSCSTIHDDCPVYTHKHRYIYQ